MRAKHPLWCPWKESKGQKNNYSRAFSCCYKLYKRASASFADNRPLSGYLMIAVHEGRISIKI